MKRCCFSPGSRWRIPEYGKKTGDLNNMVSQANTTYIETVCNGLVDRWSNIKSFLKNYEIETRPKAFLRRQTSRLIYVCGGIFTRHHALPLRHTFLLALCVCENRLCMNRARPAYSTRVEFTRGHASNTACHSGWRWQMTAAFCWKGTDGVNPDGLLTSDHVSWMRGHTVQCCDVWILSFDSFQILGPYHKCRPRSSGIDNWWDSFSDFPWINFRFVL